MDIARTALDIAGRLIALPQNVRQEVLLRVSVLVDGDGPEEAPARAASNKRHPVTACDDVPEPVAPPRTRDKSTAAAMDAVANSIVALVEGSPSGISKGKLAAALNMSVGEYRFFGALKSVVLAGRIRVEGVTNNRRYLPAGK